MDARQREALCRIAKAERAWDGPPRTFLLLHTGGMRSQIDHPGWDESWDVPSEHTIDDLADRGYLRLEPARGKQRKFVTTEAGREAARDLEVHEATPSLGGDAVRIPSARDEAHRDMDGGIDVFISHASEDKADVALPLSHALGERGWSVWIDKTELTVGDSLEGSINAALRQSRFGIVVLSPAFFSKSWPQRELQGLAAREVATGTKVILPVWHGVTRDDVLAHSPILADKLGAPTDKGIEVVADQLHRALEVARSREPVDGDQSLVQPVEQAPVYEGARDRLGDFWTRGGGMGIAMVGVRRSDRAHHSEIWRVTGIGGVEHRWVSNDEGEWHWSPWHDFEPPGVTLDVAAASKHDDHAEVFVLTENGQVWHRWWSLDNGWSDFVSFGFPLSSAQKPKSIAASSRGEGQLDVVVEAFDGALRIKWHWDGRWDESGRHDGWHPLHP